MSEPDKLSDDKFSQVVVRKRLSLQETLVERRPTIIWVLAVACFTILAWAGIPWFFITSHGSWLGFVCWMVAFLVTETVLLMLARYGGHIHRREIRQIEKLEGDLSADQAKEPLVDLQKLVDLHHKHKHYGEAAFYSQRLLHALADAAQGKLVPTVASGDCWLTTPAYKRTISAKLLWLFETRGRLLLTDETLWYWSPKVNLEVNVDDFISVERVKYSWWQKPIPMYYISLHFFAEGTQHEIYLTPGPQTGTVFDINNATTSLYEKLQHVLTKHKRLSKRS
jgi:hypothetical protein